MSGLNRILIEDRVSTVHSEVALDELSDVLLYDAVHRLLALPLITCVCETNRHKQ